MNQIPAWHLSVRNMLLLLLTVALIFMFLPWTQNIQAGGKVTTLRPEQRPQTIHATIAGRIEQWYVTEGQRVNKGDTIVHLSEVKSDYFDPDLVNRVDRQVSAKEGSIGAYSGKVDALETQIEAMYRELDSKINQIQNKIIQSRLKIESDSIKVQQAEIDRQIAQKQFNRADSLYIKGLKSLTEWEEKRLKLQEAQTKMVAAQNGFETSRQELSIYKTELRLVQNEYANKIAKTQSDKFSTLSDRFDAEANVNKLKIERENYARRTAFYYIVAPQDGYIVKAVTPGIGEIIKEGDPVVSIQPADYQLAVEMYVKPVDLPLINLGNEVRFLFDGWPAFFFSGWPGASLGTFSGKVVAIDRNISTNGRFRVLVAPNPNKEPWPNALQPGGGARGIAMLNTVPVWYELWRVLNGFPPDMYEIEEKAPDKKDDGILPKAPIKSAK
jgi:multidrug resistance efflux pump